LVLLEWAKYSVLTMLLDTDRILLLLDQKLPMQRLMLLVLRNFWDIWKPLMLIRWIFRYLP